jgi:hypothetical protein
MNIIMSFPFGTILKLQLWNLELGDEILALRILLYVNG